MSGAAVGAQHRFAGRSQCDRQSAEVAERGQIVIPRGGGYGDERFAIDAGGKKRAFVGVPGGISRRTNGQNAGGLRRANRFI